MSAYAPRVQEAMAGAVDTRKLAEAWLALHPEAATAKAMMPAISAFLGRARTAITEALRNVLVKLRTEAWVLGNRAALAAVDGLDPDWGSWTPGDYAAAEQIAGPGLRQLLGEQGIRIKSIAESRLEELSAVLEETLRSDEIRRTPGTEPLPPFLSVQDLAGRLRTVLDNPRNAELVAQAEIARAQATAARQVYAETGRTEVEISTAEDDKVCPVCEAAAKAGAHPVGAPPLVPLHPRCRCAELPVLGARPPQPAAPEPEPAGPREFSSATDASDWIAANTPELPPSQADAVDWYTSSGAYEANAALRRGEALPADVAARAAELDAAMRPLAEGLALARVLGTDAFPGGLDRLTGKTIADAAWQSASLGPRSKDMIDDVLMHITAPAGTPVVIAGRYSRMPKQREVILARGTRLRVDRVVDLGGGKWEIWATAEGGAGKSLAKAAAEHGKGATLADRMRDAVYTVVSG